LLTAQPFNARTRMLTGEAVRVLDEPVAITGHIGSFAVSATGTLVHRTAVSALHSDFGDLELGRAAAESRSDTLSRRSG
jgi:hypothetical protein